MPRVKKPLSASLEDYLEVIYHLQKRDKAARAKDIADRMKVQPASVTGALRELSARGLINYQPYSLVTLTEEGLEVAKDIIRRHEVLRKFFRTVLKLSPRQSETNACRIEHAINPDAMARLVKFIEFLERCPRAGYEWFDSFEKFCNNGINPDECRVCIEECLRRVGDSEEEKE
ncbi:metal-dependent transcriptional regulator [Thermodesulforhabdus norvegica]|uniref:Transcriptional regulator MntR n=1 Tax=Thermodesulforhabdus norvegica TaxID=39841 RepID=A0A1I4QSF7_9BACT|nr:metal-dependent transcriptional regulator [Thermodesulforhabdus norvegica]SFM42636.1 iron (metal) dependent repressor, DtxR family [Thermodesulforhabdus norvegica]